MKYLFMACALLLVACSPPNEAYYQRNPQALQEAIKNCPAKNPSNLSCEQLKAIALKINELAYQLQVNPQAFGKKILALQETIAVQKTELAGKANQSVLKETLEKNKQLLDQCMAIVQWLESPES
ncbi:MAG: hypothetical protein H0U73_13510 [Tatlockia sp.]|nr:hypothetical protein [Tatlockia sp.]